MPLQFETVVAENAQRAESMVSAAQHRHAADPRVLAALGSLALVQSRHRTAEAAYRAALDRNGHYGEARLGLGVALARRAWLDSAPLKPRSLELAALAQFMAVPDNDPCRLEALYNRAVLLRRVGRNELALNAARAYLAEKGYDKDQGARPLARLIQDEIKKPLGDELLFGDLENGGHVIVDHKNGAVVFEKQARPPKASDGPKLLN